MDFSQLYLGIVPALFSLQLLVYFPGSIGQNLGLVPAFVICRIEADFEQLVYSALVQWSSRLLVTTGGLGLNRSGQVLFSFVFLFWYFKIIFFFLRKLLRMTKNTNMTERCLFAKLFKNLIKSVVFLENIKTDYCMFSFCDV